MFKGRNKGRNMSRRGSTQKVPLKGLFSDGIWKCNCDPRLPAQRLQTKNGGKNHGRWFYTCRKAQTVRCDFFLWSDDARSRETAAVSNNSRSEPPETSEPSFVRVPHTPVKPSQPFQPFGTFITPPTTVESNGSRLDNPNLFTPYTPSKPSSTSRFFTPNTQLANTPTPTSADKGEEVYDWPSSNDEELLKVASQVSDTSVPPPETPRKAQKTDSFSTPGKRTYDEMATPSLPTPSSNNTPRDDDVFTSHPASTSTPRPPNLFSYPHLPSSADTPTPQRVKDIPSQDSELATEILQLLDNNLVPLTSEAKAGIRRIAHKHSLHTRGVTKGRDVSRALIARKHETIIELQGNIAALQAEREANRALISHLRQQRDGVGNEREEE